MRLAVALVIVGIAAPAIAEDEVVVAGLDSEELRGDALVWEDAMFFVEPWEGGSSVRFSYLSRRRDEVGRAIPVRIVSSTMRTFVEIELPDRPACSFRRVTSDPRLDGLRLFVKRDDLAPVLVKPYAATYDDGTSVKLAVGVPVMPLANGLYRVGARTDKLSLPIPHASVGYTYVAKPVVEQEPRGNLVRLDYRSTTVELDGQAFEAKSPQWLAAQPVKPADTALLVWSTRCIELVVSAPTTALRPSARMPAYVPPPPSVPVAIYTHEIPRGAPLATPGGHEVAVAGDVIGIVPPTSEGACFDAKLSMWRLDERSSSNQTVRTFKLCAPAKLVGVDASRTPTPPVSASPTATPPDVAAPPATANRTPKGVWYRVLAIGKGGTKPTATSKVKVHYAGWTTDGKLFDASYTRGQPAEFPLTAVIEGWTDGVQLMSIGDKYRFWIPEELAYKSSPHAPQGMLVFDVELLDILK